MVKLLLGKLSGVLAVVLRMFRAGAGSFSAAFFGFIRNRLASPIGNALASAALLLFERHKRYNRNSIADGENFSDRLVFLDSNSGKDQFVDDDPKLRQVKDSILDILSQGNEGTFVIVVNSGRILKDSPLPARFRDRVYVRDALPHPVLGLMLIAVVLFTILAPFFNAIFVDGWSGLSNIALSFFAIVVPATLAKGIEDHIADMQRYQVEVAELDAIRRIQRSIFDISQIADDAEKTKQSLEILRVLKAMDDRAVSSDIIELIESLIRDAKNLAGLKVHVGYDV